MGLKILLTLLLVLVNGFFVAAEFSLIRVRLSQLEIKAKEGSRLAAQALGVVRRRRVHRDEAPRGVAERHADCTDGTVVGLGEGGGRGTGERGDEEEQAHGQGERAGRRPD